MITIEEDKQYFAREDIIEIMLYRIEELMDNLVDLQYTISTTKETINIDRLKSLYYQDMYNLNANIKKELENI